MGENWAMCELLLERRADPSLQNDASRCVWDLPILKEGGQWPQCKCGRVLSQTSEFGSTKWQLMRAEEFPDLVEPQDLHPAVPF